MLDLALDLRADEVADDCGQFLDAADLHKDRSDPDDDLQVLSSLSISGTSGSGAGGA